jgi:hypothetical protein
MFPWMKSNKVSGYTFLIDSSLEVAHKELLQEPNYIIESWVQPLKTLRNFEEFESIEKLESLYEQVKPTTKTVIELFKAAPSQKCWNRGLCLFKAFFYGFALVEVPSV